MKLLIPLFFLIFTIKGYAQKQQGQLRIASFEISNSNKIGKEFFYRKSDRSILNKECVILVKKEDRDRSTSDKTVRVSTGFKEKGVFKRGYKNGLWKTLYKNKVVKVENWSNGLILGMYKVFDTKGKKLYEMVFSQNGTSRYKDFYYKTGKLKVEGNYTKGRKEGPWHYYYENGDKIKTINYIQGTPKKIQ